MTPLDIHVGTEFTFGEWYCRCTDVQQTEHSRIIDFDILSNDLFREVIGNSFYVFWPKQYNKDINE